MRSKENITVIISMLVLSVAVSGAMLFVNVICGVICTVFCIVINFVYIKFTRYRCSQIEKLNDYLSMVCSGNYSLDIDDNAEGELSILKNNLYKVVVMLQSSNEALQNDKKYLADSLADISHQLKTPLTSMMVMTDLIKQEKSNEKKNEFADIIENQLEKMKWLISTLLKLSRLDANTVDFNFANLQISDIVNESLKPFVIPLELKGINVEQSVHDFSFKGDKNWSVEAIQNIIKNCIEHTDVNGTLFIATNSTNVYDELVIADNGCGITEEDIPHIFERFYHGKNSSADSVGIGLALSKEILLKQRATIDVESKQNEGTRFSIKFYKSIV